jgi:hypothetical protein
VRIVSTERDGNSCSEKKRKKKIVGVRTSWPRNFVFKRWRWIITRSAVLPLTFFDQVFGVGTWKASHVLSIFTLQASYSTPAAAHGVLESTAPLLGSFGGVPGLLALGVLLLETDFRGQVVVVLPIPRVALLLRGSGLVIIGSLLAVCRSSCLRWELIEQLFSYTPL